MTRKSTKIILSDFLPYKTKPILLARIYHLVSAYLSDIFLFSHDYYPFLTCLVVSYLIISSAILYSAVSSWAPSFRIAPPLYVNCIFQDSLSGSLTFSKAFLASLFQSSLNSRVCLVFLQSRSIFCFTFIISTNVYSLLHITRYYFSF